MSIARVKTWSSGEVLTASDLNSEFNNILNNPVDLWSPAGKAADMNGFELVMDADADSSLTADTDDRLDVRLGGVDVFVFDGTTASTVNGLTFTGVIAGARPRLSATGSDTNIGLSVRPKGTGAGASVVLEDGSGNEVLIGGVATASAVNEVTVTNAATGNAPSIAATGGDTNVGLSIASKGTGAITLRTNAGDRLQIDSAGNAYINDTSNADVTLGLTINQGAADDNILALKSSDVAHGITGLAETDTYGSFRKQTISAGGLTIRGFSASQIGVQIAGNITSAETSKSTVSAAAVIITGHLKSGTGVTSLGANGNILAVGDTLATMRFFLDADGDSHQDVGTAWTNFDSFDDVALLDALSVAVSRPGDPIKLQFGEFLKYNREALEKAKLVTFNEDGHHFVNMSKLTMALTGAIRQIGRTQEALAEKLTLLEQRLALPNQ